MGRLIISEGRRMVKTLCFKIYIIFSAVYGAVTVLSEYINVTNMKNAGYDVTFVIDNMAFGGCISVLVVGAVFVGMFIGREYSDGTVRNKLVVGHGRFGIYLSNFLLCAVANVAAALVNLIVTFALGIPVFGMEKPVEEMALLIFIAIIACIAITSVLVLIPMLISKKAVATAILILSVFFMFGLTSFIDSRLKEPEYWGGMEMVVTEEGNPEFRESEKVKNPHYLDEDARKVFEFFDDFLPFSQIYHVVSLEAPELAKTAVYDIIILIAVTEAGILVFRKKDIK